jgi:hypothetical protein
LRSCGRGRRPMGTDTIELVHRRPRSRPLPPTEPVGAAAAVAESWPLMAELTGPAVGFTNHLQRWCRYGRRFSGADNRADGGPTQANNFHRPCLCSG